MREMLLALIFSAWGLAQPVFSPQRVLPANSSRAIALEPGMIMSIYGESLGPAIPCIGYADQHERETANPLVPDQFFVNTLIYPKQLCEVQVRVGGEPAGLLYVSEKQINFKVPQDVALSGTADLRVIYRSQISAPAVLPLGIEVTRVSLAQPAYIDMPIWLHIELPLNRAGSIRYPYVLGPAGFGCNTVEVRRNGVNLKPIPEADWFKGGMLFSGNICGSFSVDTATGRLDRLPLHLLYRFDIPGKYEVRFTMKSDMNREVMHSEWTAFEVRAGQPSQRAALLADARRNPSTDAGFILSDLLPSILGFPGDESFAIVAEHLYHPSRAVRRYAQQGLSYWPDELVRSRLLKLLETQGPTDELIQRLSWPEEFLRAHASEIIRASLKFIDSDSPVLQSGAERGINIVPLRTVEPRIVQDLITKAANSDGTKATAFIDALGNTHDARAHELLWSLQGKGIGADRPLYSIARFQDPADLPKLGAALIESGHGSDPRGQIAYLPYYLHTNFGAGALPYLQTAVSTSPYTFVRTNSAEELVTAGWSAGFAFMAGAIRENRSYCQEMVQFLKDRFPELKNADTARLLAFLTEKSASGIPRP